MLEFSVSSHCCGYSRWLSAARLFIIWRCDRTAAAVSPCYILPFAVWSISLYCLCKDAKPNCHAISVLEKRSRLFRMLRVVLYGTAASLGICFVLFLLVCKVLQVLRGVSSRPPGDFSATFQNKTDHFFAHFILCLLISMCWHPRRHPTD